MLTQEPFEHCIVYNVLVYRFSESWSNILQKRIHDRTNGLVAFNPLVLQRSCSSSEEMAHRSELNTGKRRIKCIVFSKLFNDIFRQLLNTNYSFSVSLCSPKCFKDILMCCNVIIKILAHVTTNLEFHQMHSQINPNVFKW